MTDPDYPSSFQKPNLALMFFTLYLKILFIIESFKKQDYKLKIPKEYDCNTHSQCQCFTPTFPPPDFMTPSYPAFFSLTSKQKTDTITQWIRPSHDDPTPFHYSNPPPPSSKKPNYLFNGIKKYPMDNLPIAFGPPDPLDPLLTPGT
ncbi:hypothetical protein O181_020233 [Austropuccinia psidii MF-1]|uniref:Uncharacterized protein n=1 Tax=Austropuccinia psidii MF-1 TaxID=1389203 RepID=A0A9Q3GUB6_9BASI|nr:hypothetical protein [Austropuccinia psidii MF-1]